MNPLIFVVYNRALSFSQDEAVSVQNRVAFRKVSNMIFGKQFLPALTYLCRHRAVEKLWKGDDKPFEEVADELAMMLIGEAQSLESLAQIREGMGPWAKTGVASFLFVAREVGLKTIVKENSK